MGRRKVVSGAKRMNNKLMNEHNKWNTFIETPFIRNLAKVHSVQEQFFVAKGPKAKIGDVCLVGEHSVLCEVIAIEKENNMLLPFEQTEKVCYGDSVTLIAEDVGAPVVIICLAKC